MRRLIKEGILAIHMLMLVCLVLFCSPIIVHAESTMSASLAVNRTEGTCNYTVTGIDQLKNNSMTMEVTRLDDSDNTVIALQKDISLTAENCVNGTYKDVFTISELKELQYAEYTVSFTIGSEKITAKETCDFTVHADQWTMTADNNTGVANRVFQFAPKKGAKGEYRPGKDNELSLYIWKKGTAESQAVLAGSKQAITDKAVSWTVDMSKISNSYGTYYAKAVISNSTGKEEAIHKIQFLVQPSCTSFTAKATNALEANKSFGIYLQGLKNIYGVKKVTFYVYNSSGKKVYSCVGVDQSQNTSYFYATITLKSLNYKLDKYTVKAVVTDNNGTEKLVSTIATADETKKGGTLKATSKSDKSVRLSLKDAYIPGKIKSVTYEVYVKAAGKSKAQTYTSTYTSSSNTFAKTISITNFKNKKTGTYVVNAYGMTQWGTKVLLNQTTFKIKAATAKAAGKNPSSSNGAFEFRVADIDSPSGVSAVTVKVWQSGETKDAYTYTAKKTSAGYYTVKVDAKNHDYHFGTYHAKAYVTMGNGIKVRAVTSTYTFKPVNFIYMKETNVKNCKKIYIYNPSQSGKITFQVYSKVNGMDDSATYTGKTSGKYSYGLIKLAKIKNAGTVYVKVKANGEAFKTYTFKMDKSDLLKNGWHYEKYNGKTYKFYYVEGEKQTDLTDVMGIQESSTSNVNNFIVEVNRAACTVTVYAYDSLKKSYCIPVKTFTVSIGRDTWTTKGAGALTTETSFTPLGDFTITGNGNGVKYTMKPMNEPDGSVCYARWATHVVGNVYFHSVAVGADSHYALSPTQYNRLGTAASAGCIRMTVADSKWIYDYVSKGTTVKIVQGTTKYPGPLGKNATIKISSSIHYDPTDPAVPNATKEKDYKAGRINGYITASGKKVGVA